MVEYDESDFVAGFEWLERHLPLSVLGDISRDHPAKLAAIASQIEHSLEQIRQHQDLLAQSLKWAQELREGN
jgi:hypothetical protein